MKILYLVPHVPNLTKARSYYHIRGLHEAGHELTIATVARSKRDVQHVETLQGMGIKVLWVRTGKARLAVNATGALLTGLPLQARLLWSSALQRQIDEYLVSTTPDIIHVEHLRMAAYGIRYTSRYPVIWDAVDHLASLYRRTGEMSNSLFWKVFGRIEAPRLERYEIALTGQFSCTLVISSYDQTLFQRDNPYAQRVRLAMPGLPFDLLPTLFPRADNILIFTGSFSYHPNIVSARYMVEQILPLVRQQKPDVRLQIVGAHPDTSVVALQGEHVEVTGFVPSLAEYISRATVSVAPILYASGMQNKVLEAFFAVTPVVGTSVALRGFDVHDGEQALIADTPQAFADAIIRLLSDTDLRERMGEAGYQYAAAHHDLKVTTRKLVDIYQEVIAEYQTRGG